MTYYDDIGEAYPWAVELPVAALSLDFLGVPGSVLGSDTAALIEKHGFPDNKRLGAGVVDGRSVWADGQSAPNLIGALIGKARPRAVSAAPSCCLPGGSCPVACASGQCWCAAQPPGSVVVAPVVDLLRTLCHLWSSGRRDVGRC